MQFNTGIVQKIRWYAKRVLNQPSSAVPAVPDTPAPLSPAEEKTALGKRYVTNGALPSDFTITLGVAPCNYSCLFCPQSVSKPKKAQWLELDLLEKCLSEMPEDGVQLNISSFSETIAAHNLVAAVQMMKRIRPRLRIVMATNGSLFRESVVEAVIEAGLDHYSYSFDAPTREKYREIIQVDNFDKAWANLERVAELRNRKSSKMIISTHIMHFKGVEEDFEKFKSHWEGKIDHVYLRSVGNWGGSDELGLTSRLESLGYVSAHEAPARRHPCMSIFMHFQLQPDGYYMPCLGTTADYASNQEYSLGHASDTTWREAWERLGTMRRAHLEGRWNDVPACRNCNIWSLWKDVWHESPEGQEGPDKFRLEQTEYAK